LEQRFRHPSLHVAFHLGSERVTPKNFEIRIMFDGSNCVFDGCMPMANLHKIYYRA
jgi:hypothetical protein